MKKYFVFDVDGTLLTDKGNIDDATVQALNMIKNNKNEIILASARPLMGIYFAIESLKLDIEFIIALNGAVICKKNQIIDSKKIDKLSMLNLARTAENMNLILNFYTKNKWYVYGNSSLVEEEADIVNMEPNKLDKFESIIDIDEGVFKILLLGKKIKIKEITQNINQNFKNVEASISKPNYCEIVNKNVSKGQALVDIMENIEANEPKNIIVFGDGENDISMILKSDYGIAMGNSSNKVKKHADFVTKTNNQSGILYAIKKLNLLGDEN